MPGFECIGGFLDKLLFLSPNRIFFHVMLNCDLLEVDISYSFNKYNY